MKLEELRLLNSEEIEDFRKQSPANAMLVGRHLRWLYKHKIETLKKANLDHLIPEWEKKLEDLDAKNKGQEREPDSRPDVSKETKGKRSPKKSKVELQEAVLGDMAQGQ